MEPEVRKAPIRFFEIDLIRILAALSVVAYHYTYRGHAADDFSPIAYPELGRVTRYGYLGVEIFFMVSGYVISISAQGKTVRQFFLSRITRLFPLYWIACTLTFAVKHFFGRGLPSHYLYAGWGQYAYGLTMMHQFFGIDAIDEVYWTISVEVQFYFIIAILLGWKLLRHSDGFLIFWLAYAALVGPAGAGTPFTLLLLPQFCPFFAAGWLFFLLQQKRTWLRYVLLIVSYILAIRTTVYRADGQLLALHGYVSRQITVAIVTVFFVLFYLIITRKINLSRFTWLSIAGGLTYPLYLIHSDIAFVFFHRLGYQLNKYALLVGMLMVMLTVAYGLSKIEKPLGKRLGIIVNGWLQRLDT